MQHEHVNTAREIEKCHITFFIKINAQLLVLAKALLSIDFMKAANLT